MATAVSLLGADRP